MSNKTKADLLETRAEQKQAAEWQAEKIKAYWASQGYDVKVEVVQLMDRQAGLGTKSSQEKYRVHLKGGYVIRSNMVNGMPVEMALGIK